MENFIIVAILTVIVLGIVIYLVRVKKKNSGCIGCPYAKKCSGKCNKNAKAL